MSSETHGPQIFGPTAGEAGMALVSGVQRAHLAMGSCLFALAGSAPGSAPLRAVHDTVVSGIYGAARAAILGTNAAAEGLASKVARVPATSKQGANLAVAILNAAVGDRLHGADSALAIRMSLRSNSRDIPVRMDTLLTAYRHATPRLAIFLHGLGETESSWQLHADAYCEDETVTYGSRLAAAGYTPLYLRYNTGLHISENGRYFSDLLSAIVTEWPGPVEEIIIVAHSMGGLVARSACHYGETTDQPWIPTVRHIFYLGVPHLGAPLERVVSYYTWALSKTNLTRPVARLINRRSAGIKDLRFGYVVDDDWTNCDPDTCLKSHRHDVPLLSGAKHFSISASITAGHRHPLGRIVGDFLVPPASAHGRRPRQGHVQFDSDHRHHLGRAHHFDLLNHPSVYSVMETQLQTNGPSPVHTTTTG